MPSPSTPSDAHARRALVGPRSGPPCFREPPTIVGAISSADFFQAVAPRHLFSDIKSKIVSPTVFGGEDRGAGHENLCEWLFRIPMNTTRGLSCGTPKSAAFSKFQPV